MNPILRDKCYGRRLARCGGASIVTRNAERVPTRTERIINWRWRAQEPGITGTSPREPSRADAGSPSCIEPRPRAAGVDGSGIHESPCNCVDDAQLHWARVARSLIGANRQDEITEDMWQAYRKEFEVSQRPAIRPF